MIGHSPVEDRGELETRAHPLCGCRWWNKPAPQIDQWLCVHNRKGCSKSCANRVTWPTQKVICCEPLPPPKLVVFSLLIKHVLPTAKIRLTTGHIPATVVTVPNIYRYSRWYLYDGAVHTAHMVYGRHPYVQLGIGIGLVCF